MRTNKGQLRYASLLSFLIACALFLSARLIYAYLADAQRYPINTIKIAASYQHISHKHLEAILNNYLNASFFSLSVGRLHQQLLTLPWVKQVQIERVWPDTVKITVVEKQAIARWNNEFLAKNGEIFAGNEEDTAENNLPYLTGPTNQQQEVLQVFEKMSNILSMYGLHAIALAKYDNEAWGLTLANGVMLRLGKQDFEKRLLRFCKAYPTVFAEKAAQLVSVDLRYPRGMAAQWKK